MDFNLAKMENSNKSLNNLTYLDLERFEKFRKQPNIDYTMSSHNFVITEAPSFTASKIIDDGKTKAYSGVQINYVENEQTKNSFTKEFKKIR
jgi:hypothetical protein